ncbi:PspC domain-containing protein [Massilia yuzhufengensis]|uniref:Phage shock protein C (PspC) family protein n=1 Tax=Massilia yuzhufengensis TaxID=1164594 RepID=A0A1I1HIB2_9BURK|nr:PspC domain-containing protein [Massilia yuzhufengensis]SFC21698.1 phage shock protein C (PspC) family protein [Massilia yuzhufengensis]
MNLSDEIKRLHELHQAGALSDVEFEMAKARVLSSANVAGPGVNLNKGSGDNIANSIQNLRRSRTDRWLGGVCGGLAPATGVESWVWRLMFALFAICFGFGFLVYLLLWIFVPEE